MLAEQFKAVIYTVEGEYVEELGEEVLGLEMYTVGPFPTYDLAKQEVERAAKEDKKFDHGSIEKVFVWEE